MKKTSEKWIAAAKLFAEDINSVVKCPECEIGVLKVKDELIEDWNKIDRYMICNNCGKWNVITFQAPDNYLGKDL